MKRVFANDPYLFSTIRNLYPNLNEDEIEKIFRECSKQDSWRIADIERYAREMCSV